jgi:hypothetical protein
MALVMARPDERNPAVAAGSVRLVQDFGRASDPAGCLHPGPAPNASALPAPAKRSRGRPPGSKNKTPGMNWATTGPARLRRRALDSGKPRIGGRRTSSRCGMSASDGRWEAPLGDRIGDLRNFRDYLGLRNFG